MKKTFLQRASLLAASLLVAVALLSYDGGTGDPPGPVEPPVETPVATATVTTPAPAPTSMPAPAPETTPDTAPTEPSENASKIAVRDIKRDSVLTLREIPYFEFMDYGYASITRDGTQLPYDLGYGIDLICEDTFVYLNWHNYTDEALTPGMVTITNIYYNDTYELRDLTEVDEDGLYRLKTAKVENGPYAIDVVWSNDTHTVAHIWVNGDDVYACQTSYLPGDYICDWYDRYDDIIHMAELTNTTPEDSLDWGNERFAYPVKADENQRKYRCDNQRWTDLAQELVPDLSIPDAQKALVIHDWMVDNLAYDNYKAYTLDMSRAKYYNDYSGKYSMWDTHTGVCADFATVYCMMLRSVGVPCTSLVQDGVHIWNLVWLNDSWVEIDITADVYKHVCSADLNDISYDIREDYAGFGGVFDTSRLSDKYFHVSWGMYTVNFQNGTGEY